MVIPGGMMSLGVKSKTHESVLCEVVDGGELKSRRHLNVRGKSATLPSITGMSPLVRRQCTVCRGFDFVQLMGHRSADY
jgi:pyruvate kinase